MVDGVNHLLHAIKKERKKEREEKRREEKRREEKRREEKRGEEKRREEKKKRFGVSTTPAGEYGVQQPKCTFKGAPCSVVKQIQTQNFNVYDIYEVQTLNNQDVLRGR